MLNVKIVELLLNIIKRSTDPDIQWEGSFGVLRLSLKNGYRVGIQCFQFGEEEPVYEFFLDSDDVKFSSKFYDPSPDYLVLRALYWAATRNIMGMGGVSSF